MYVKEAHITEEETEETEWGRGRNWRLQRCQWQEQLKGFGRWLVNSMTPIIILSL